MGEQKHARLEREFTALEQAIGEISVIARQMGLDYFPMRYELCPAEVLYAIGAYGMPTRFSHWSFGKAFSRMKMEYDLELSKIYELVINSNPCYAFLLENNSFLQNKLIVAHVLGHSDFFKHNAYFGHTNRDMVERMSVAAERIRLFEFEHGRSTVEETLDAALSIQEHIDPIRIRSKMSKGVEELAEEKDIMGFIAEHSRSLAPWQREIISILREEMLYFWPQLETKIMNEGWATFWHVRLMRELELSEAETIEFARMHASVIQPPRYGINPYLLGLQMFEALEQQYGLEYLFEVRERENDISFLRNYLTKERLEQTDLYMFAKQGGAYRITNVEWESVKQRLIDSRTNGGYPYLVVLDGDYGGNGELYLLHKYEGVELDVRYMEKTLPSIVLLWGRAVHLETIVNGNRKRYTMQTDKKMSEKTL
ncbi:SpoVR family protein [Brevibacillus sp. NRS-1366]|uniref:SpoVR family protein n=1 Tax=Brevibacillus sp. NRS-1366 TaxID=3233899 RepID=UPI003D1AF6B5